MPEGHTIHMLAADHRKTFARKSVRVSSPQGRFVDAAKVDRRVLRDVRAYGKNLFYDFGSDRIIHVHLGLHGKFRLTPLEKGEPPPEPRGAVRMRIMTERAVLDLNGPIRCEIVGQASVDETIDRLGPDVLDPKADADGAWEKIRKRSTSIGILLMDQTIISGIGNAYRCELLYRQRIHPLMPGKSLIEPAFRKLWKDAAHLLRMGVRHRQAWAVDETDKLKKTPMIDGVPDRYNVYKKLKCRGCGTKIKIIPLGGRKCFMCPREQSLRRSRA